MHRTFAATTLMAVGSAYFIPSLTDDWPYPSVEFEAIEQGDWHGSTFWMNGRYGPYNTVQEGENAYIYFEIGGGELTEDQVVSMWISIWDPISSAVTNVETAECVVVYKEAEPVSADVNYDLITYATSEDISVRTYSGEVENGRFSFTGE